MLESEAAGKKKDAVDAPSRLDGEGRRGKLLLTTDRLPRKLREHDVEGERAIALAQAAICAFVLCLHLVAKFNLGWETANFSVVSSLAALLFTSGIRLYLADTKILQERPFDVLNLTDMVIFMSLLWSYQFAYEHPAGGVLKTPTFVLVFSLIGLRALRFHPKPILIAGITAAAGWALIAILAVTQEGSRAITHSYKAYLTSHDILIGAEVEKVVALTALTLFLAVATYKARKLLSKAADADDYAEALEVSHHSLAEARRSQLKAEEALAKLDQRDAALTEQNTRFTAALENMSQGLCMFDKDWRLVVCNRPYVDMYGLAPELAEPGTPLRKILEHRVENGIYCGKSPEEYIEAREKVVRANKVSVKIEHRTDGRVMVITHRPMADGGWVATHEDITEIQRIQRQIAHMERHDPLTDLPNRANLRTRIADALGDTRGNDNFAIICLGLDRFKTTNDTLGHSLGDELLKAVGKRLQCCVRESDTVARLGGDEFAILQRSAGQPNDATLLAKRIRDILKDPFELQGHKVVAGASLGIAIAPADGTDPDQLLKSADMALDRAKAQGGGTYSFFEPEMDAMMRKRSQLESELRGALHGGEFELHYQPLVNLQTNDLTGFEVLLRWENSKHGRVSPAEFVPLAEETGLVVPMGEWVLKEACRQAAKWPDHIKIAVNLSPAQFRSKNLALVVVSALGESGLSPSRLELEITESVILQDNDTVLDTLRQLRDLGVRIAMDDFGTGYSSLSYLRSFQFDKIKLDGSFVQDISKGDDAMAIVDAVAALGKSLGMITTAEGVETQEQYDCVRAAGYTEMQGFYFSDPRSAEEIEELYFSEDSESKSVA